MSHFRFYSNDPVHTEKKHSKLEMMSNAVYDYLDGTGIMSSKRISFHTLLIAQCTQMFTSVFQLNHRPGGESK